MRLRSFYTAKRFARPSYMVGVVLLLACVGECAYLCGGCAFFDHNFRTVEDAKLYRSGQLPPQRLEQAIKDTGIRTVISLRGSSPASEWYREERQACETHSVAHYDLQWSKERLPDPDSLALFVKWCQTADKPILVHCLGGVHRSGVASAIYLLVEGESPERAREQFGPFFNNAPIGKLVDLYDGKKPFAEWAVKDYPALYASLVPPETK